jgi:hypothetical protein
MCRREELVDLVLKLEKSPRGKPRARNNVCYRKLYSKLSTLNDPSKNSMFDEPCFW